MLLVMPEHITDETVIERTIVFVKASIMPIREGRSIYNVRVVVFDEIADLSQVCIAYHKMVACQDRTFMAF